jgi:hypothetical protein
MTLLEAVNLLLEVIGVAPVSSLLTGETNVDVETALRSIHTTSMAVQAQGWDFNTEGDVEPYILDPHPTTGEVTFPANALKVDVTGTDRYEAMVWRGRKLYDKRNRTFNIGRPVEVVMVIGLDFEDLTQTARTYITVRAARGFERGRAVVQDRYTEAQEYAALAAMEAEEDQSDDRTLFDKNPHLRRRAGRRRRA